MINKICLTMEACILTQDPTKDPEGVLSLARSMMSRAEEEKNTGMIGLAQFWIGFRSSVTEETNKKYKERR
jgi:hypothetical protein